MKRVTWSDFVERGVEVNMSPLIDCVFLLLIFFIVTTVFVEETGVEIQKPRAVSAQDMDKHPKFRRARNNLGRVYLLQEKTDQAIALYQELLRIDPLDARALLLLARGQRRQGRLEEAALTCERAARLPGFEAEAWVLHAQIEVERERYGRALELLEAAQTLQDRPHVRRYLEQVRRLAP